MSFWKSQCEEWTQKRVIRKKPHGGALRLWHEVTMGRKTESLSTGLPYYNSLNFYCKKCRSNTFLKFVF